MKQAFFLSSVILILISILGNVQANASVIQNFNDTTSKTLKGTVIKNGRVNLSPGYKITFSKDKKTGTIRKDNGNSITGSFSCGCKSQIGGPYTCIVGQASNGSVVCGGAECCVMSITTSTSDLSATSGSNDGNITWKVLIIPKTNTTTASN